MTCFVIFRSKNLLDCPEDEVCCTQPKEELKEPEKDWKEPEEGNEPPTIVEPSLPDESEEEQPTIVEPNLPEEPVETQYEPLGCGMSRSFPEFDESENLERE